MKTSPKLGRVMPRAVVALCIFGACTCATDSFAQYPPGQPKPRVGTRFLNFVKDLVWGEEPENRYHGYNPPPNSTRQHSYGAQGGRRYNLDNPPPAAAYDAPPAAYNRPVPHPQNQNHLTQPREQEHREDMPYSTPRPQQKAQEPARMQEEPPTPVKQKPRVEEPQKKAEETPPHSSRSGLFSRKSEPKKEKEVEESLPESKPDTQPLKVTNGSSGSKPAETPKHDPPAETPKETVVASNNSNKDKISNSGSGSATPASTGATLTGSKTAKAGLVKSPYPPYNELDVTGLPSGSLAMDPTTGKVFRVP